MREAEGGRGRLLHTQSRPCCRRRALLLGNADQPEPPLGNQQPLGGSPSCVSLHRGRAASRRCSAGMAVARRCTLRGLVSSSSVRLSSQSRCPSLGPGRGPGALPRTVPQTASSTVPERQLCQSRRGPRALAAWRHRHPRRRPSRMDGTGGGTEGGARGLDGRRSGGSAPRWESLKALKARPCLSACRLYVISFRRSRRLTGARTHTHIHAHTHKHANSDTLFLPSHTHTDAVLVRPHREGQKRRSCTACLLLSPPPLPFPADRGPRENPRRVAVPLVPPPLPLRFERELRATSRTRRRRRRA